MLIGYLFLLLIDTFINGNLFLIYVSTNFYPSCEEKRSRLVAIETQEELDFLVATSMATHKWHFYWTGEAHDVIN